MTEEGYISDSDAESVKREELAYSPKKNNLNTTAPHFALMVKNMLIEKYGENYVVNSMLHVKTTINLEWQEYSQDILKQQIAGLKNNRASNGAVVIIDPKTGEILAYVGSHDWHDNLNGKIDMVQSPRQPGSSFKPIIYSAAFEDRIITPATVIEDKLTTFPGNYKPRNFDSTFRGPVTVCRALANSLNAPSVKIMEKVGVENGLFISQRFGLTTLDPNNPSRYGLSLVLGSGEVRLIELTSAYSVFANSGIRNKPLAILEVRGRDNEIINKFESEAERVISEDVAYLISSILSDSRTRREEFGVALDINKTSAVKTGTTEDFRDALTFGYTPSLTIGVWVGNNDNSPMDRIAGSLGAAPIWRLLMTRFLSGKPDENFEKPISIVRARVCPYINFDTKEASSPAFMEYFMEGTESRSISCNIMPTITISPTEEIILTGTPTEAPTPTPTPTEIPTPTIEID